MTRQRSTGVFPTSRTTRDHRVRAAEQALARLARISGRVRGRRQELPRISVSRSGGPAPEPEKPDDPGDR